MAICAKALVRDTRKLRARIHGLLFPARPACDAYLGLGDDDEIAGLAMGSDGGTRRSGPATLRRSACTATLQWRSRLSEGILQLYSCTEAFLPPAREEVRTTFTPSARLALSVSKPLPRGPALPFWATAQTIPTFSGTTAVVLRCCTHQYDAYHPPDALHIDEPALTKMP